MQQDHNVHNTNGAILSHHPSYTSTVLPNATANFAASNLPNGHPSTTRGGQAQQINEHWAEQLKLHKEIERAHQIMTTDRRAQYYARKNATSIVDGRTASPPADVAKLATEAPASEKVSAEDVEEDRGRPANLDEVRRQDWHNIDLSGQGLRVLSAPVFGYDFLNQLYISSNKITRLPPEIGKLRQLRLLDASHNLLKELPVEIGMCVYLKELLLFDNQIHKIPSEAGSLFNLEMLGIEGNPLDPEQKTEIMEKGTKSLISKLRESASIPAPPAVRQLLDLQDGASTGDIQDRVKVFSFNILCDRACTTQLYGHSPSASLSWEFRRAQILQEIQAQDADIVCLQEVDQESFNEYFCSKLSYNGYKGIFWPKSRAKTMSEKDAKMVDGCATFYKHVKYILLDKQLVEFASIAINKPDMKSQPAIFNRVMPKDQHAVVSFFENRQTGSRMIVTNTHLHWDPRYADVKVVQTAILMENVSKLAEKYVSWPPTKDKDKKAYALSDNNTSGDGEAVDDAGQEYAPSMKYTSSTQIPLIIAGDFNSLADSGVYELLSSGGLSGTHSDFGPFEYGNFTRDGIQHPFSLRSSYASLHGGPDELTFTNYTPGFVGVVDYIWYSTNTLELTTLLGPVDPVYMKRVPGFPNYHFPSDHLSLLAEFQIKGRKEKRAVIEPEFGRR